MTENLINAVESRTCAGQTIEGHELVDLVEYRPSLVALVELKPVTAT